MATTETRTATAAATKADEGKLQAEADKACGAGRCVTTVVGDAPSGKRAHAAFVVGGTRYEVDTVLPDGTERSADDVAELVKPLLAKGTP